MITCPNCHKNLPDGSRFCDNCGTLIPDALQSENPVPGAPYPAGNPSESAANQPEAPARTASGKKGGLIKGILIGVGAVVLIAAIVVLVLVLLKGRGNKSAGNTYSDGTFYIKENQLYFTKLKGGEPEQVSRKLFPDAEEFTTQMPMMLNGRLTITADGKRVFYLDRVSGNSNTLYYKELGKSDAEAVKIDSDVNSFQVLKGGSGVIYQKNDEDRTLYYHNLKERERIAREVRNYRASEDGKQLYYIDSEGNAYVRKGSEERIKIDSELDYFSYVKDFTEFIYLRDGTIYKRVAGGDREKIASNVNRISWVHSENSIYYTKEEKNEGPLSRFVTDDMAAQDASLEEPEYPPYPDYPYFESPDYPTYPDYPSRYDYDSRSDYEKAVTKYNEECDRIDEEYEKAYEKAREEYDELCKQIEEEYTKAQEKFYADYELYDAKLNRDRLRESLEDNTYEYSTYELFYYDGKESVSVAKNFLSTDLASANAGILIYEALPDEVSLPKINLSDVEFLDDVYDKLDEATDKEGVQFIASGADTAELDLGDNISYTRFSDDGKTIWFLQDVQQEKYYGDLYKATIDGTNVSTPELVREEIYIRYAFGKDNQLIYFTDVNEGVGDLFVNGEKVDEEVYVGTYSIDASNGKIFYYVDYNREKSRGTLRIYDGKQSVTVNDDVYSYRTIPDGSVLFLTDYSTKRMEGELYVFRNGKAEKLDEEVNVILDFNVAP